MRRVTKEDIGKRILFKPICRWNTALAVRVIKDIRSDGSPIVRFGGYGNFCVRPCEVLEILEEAK